MTKAPMPKDVPPYEGTDIQPDGLRVSRTGAALGRPELEESQYGLTKPGEAGLTEREVRGVESPATPKQRD